MNSMYLALGYRCNHHCFFCPCGNRDTKIAAATTEELIYAIEIGIKEKKINHITLSGGEPTLHPGFHEIIKYCLQQKLAVGVLSNGDTFHSLKNVHCFFDDLPNGQLQITTALHSHIPALHNNVTGKQDSFQNTVEGILNVMSFGIPVTVKQVISKWNYQTLPEFVDYIYGKFGPSISLTLCGMDFCGMKDDMTNQVAVSYPQIGCYLEKALDFVNILRKQYSAFPSVTVTDLPLCCVDPYYWGYFVKVSRNALSQYSAPQDNTGIVKTNTEVVNDCDTFFDACTRCSVSNFCPGVWRTSSLIFGESAVHSIQALDDKPIVGYKPLIE